ncbi:hypothetical protein CDAR_239061, partial [Caerostris darwini]
DGYQYGSDLQVNSFLPDIMAESSQVSAPLNSTT